MKVRFSYLVFPVGLAGVIAACSGSDSQDVVIGPDASTDQSVETGPTVDSGAVADAIYDQMIDVAKDTFSLDTGIPNLLDAGGAYEGGVPCIVGGLLESEPQNDVAGAADNLDAQNATRCGVSIPGADAGADLDHMKFKLEASSTSFFLYFEGSVKLTVTVETDGGTQSVVMTPTSSPPLPFVKDKFYTIKLESLDGLRQNWRVTLFQS